MTNKSIVKSSAPYLAAFVGLFYFYKLFVRPFLSPLRKIPGRPYKPIVGNMMEALKSEAMTNTINWMKEYKSRIVRYYYFYGEARVLIGDPEMAKHVLVTNSKAMQECPWREEHHSLRKILNPAFNSHAVNAFIPQFEDIAKEAVSVWKDQLALSECDSLVVPAQDFMSRITLDAICRCGFDYDMASVTEPDSAGVKSFQRILQGFQLRLSMLLPLQWLPTKKNKEAWADFKFFKSTINDIVSQKREKMHMGEAQDGKDLLSLLLHVRDEKGEHISELLLCSQVGGFLFAGFETTSMNLTWTLLLLAQHPEVQETARQEVMTLLSNDPDEPITTKTVDSLKYLTCVIKESLRLYPPVSVVFRKAIHNDYLGGYFIPAGTPVGVSIGSMHRLPELWEDPDSFKPERFLSDYDHYKFLPFITGPYMCIGHIFSLTETKVVLATLLRNFRMTLPKDYTFRRVRQLTLKPSPPLKLIISPI